MATVPKRVRAK